MMPLLDEAQISLADRTNMGTQKVEGRKPLSEEKFPNEPILKIVKPFSINDIYQKTNSRIAKSKPRWPRRTTDNVAGCCHLLLEMLPL